MTDDRPGWRVDRAYVPGDPPGAPSGQWVAERLSRRAGIDRFVTARRRRDLDELLLRQAAQVEAMSRLSGRLTDRKHTFGRVGTRVIRVMGQQRDVEVVLRGLDWYLCRGLNTELAGPADDTDEVVARIELELGVNAAAPP